MLAGGGLLAGGLLAGCDGAPAPIAAPVRPGPRRFPAGFVWGAATSAYQVEGAAAVDGRGPSVWDTFAATPGRTADGDTGDVAADQYHRYRQDIALMSSLGLHSYRFSISWSRVLPTGAGAVNTKGLDYYRRLVDALRTAGITPLPTLWHWDTPQALQDRGGWESRDTAERFADYAAIVYEALGDDVGAYLTVNEPKTVVDVGYRYGAHAPGLRDPDAAARVLHHLLLGHGLAVQALRASGSRARIGPVLNLAPCYPADTGVAARQAALVRDAQENRLYLDPIFTGRYPKDAAAALAWPALAAVLRPGDLKVIASPVDLLAVNYYNPVFVDAAGAGVHKHPLAEPAEWLEIYPQGLYDILTRVHRDYGAPAMMITENGRPTVTDRDAAGHYPDTDRIDFLRDHFVQVHRAISTGVKVEGFQVWSLLDNFEWAEGYRQRWGLVQVDFTTQERTPKQSAAWYADVIRKNAV